MENILITFNHLGKEYTGHFSKVSGGGSHLYHLMIDNYYKGQLFHSDNYGWQFHEGFKGMADYFGEYIMAWYK